MATSNPQASGDFVTQALEERRQDMSWLARYKGTVISVTETVVMLASVVLSLGFGLPEWVTVVLVAVIGMAESLGIRVYKPEVTRNTQAMVRDAIAEKIDNSHGVSGRP